MSAYLSKISLVPGFPSYTGAYKVGTIDVEIPIVELQSPAPIPAEAAHIKTIQFRMYYPAAENVAGKKIPWLPNPQRAHLVGYTQFLGAGPFLAEILSFFPRHLHYASIPAIKNAMVHLPIVKTATNANSDSDSLESQALASGWPTMIFSHGLGGSRNAYSHIVGSIASHGVVVFCPEHRDGSSVVTFIRDASADSSFRRSNNRICIPYRRIEHVETPEVSATRDAQLRVRCWELGLLYNAILAVNSGRVFRNLNTSTPAANIESFEGILDIHRPGSVIFAGHSFGSATIVQFLKSVFYHDHPKVKEMKNPLYVPSPDSELVRQITPRTLTILLDMWCFPLISPFTRPLFSLPLPAYVQTPEYTAPGGSTILAVESESFFKWTEHLHTTARVISPPLAALHEEISPLTFEIDDGIRLPEPNMFYVETSAHLNQSDFGVLFPWLTKKIFGAESPERALRLNQRAILQLFRSNGVPVSGTSVGDFVEGGNPQKKEMALEFGKISTRSDQKDARDVINDDPVILQKTVNNPIKYWQWIDVIGLGKASYVQADSSEAFLASCNNRGRDMKELEPHLASDVLPFVT